MNIKKIISILFVIVWFVIIFYFSNMNTNESNQKSKETINKVVETTQIETNNNLTEEKQEQLVEKLNKPLRKVMHLTEYFILALLLINALNLNNIKNKYLITIIICIIYALTDEYHQTFISGRTGQLTDVIIDTLGAILGITLNKIISKSKEKTN